VRVVTAEQQGLTFAGVLDESRVVPIAGAARIGPALLGALPDVSLEPDRAVSVQDVRLLPPVPEPGKVICVGLNYAAHIAETRRGDSDYPILFTKFATSLIGAFDPIVKPEVSEQVDYEGELAVIIGKPTRDVAAASAMDSVAGYAVANDVTVRDYQYKTHQWLQGKAWDRSTPVGPALVTPDEVGDPQDLELELTLNGEVMQSSSTSLMIFDIATLISVVSQFTTLRPGDILLTGTPGGVGYRRDPQVFLNEGDVVAVDIGRVGRIENRVVADDTSPLS
jgi:acylpyruvate hydrolase